MSRKESTQITRLRQTYFWLMAMLAIMFVAVVIRIVYVQIVQGPKLREAGKVSVLKQRDIDPVRGDLLAEDGRVLTTTAISYEIWFDFRGEALDSIYFFRKVDSLALGLSRQFGDYTPNAWSRLLKRGFEKGKRAYCLTPRPVSHDELMELEQLPLLRERRRHSWMRVRSRRDRKRLWGSLASRTLGQERYGTGLEAAYDALLKGRTGKQWAQRTQGGMWIPIMSEDPIPAVDGYDVVTTLDMNLQDVADHELREQLRLHNAEQGSVVVMDVATGEIKAIVNLTRDRSSSEENPRYIEAINLAVGHISEPGSTMKAATFIAMLEAGKISLNDSVDTGNGEYRAHRHIFRDSHRGGWGRIPAWKVFEKSSNVGVVKLMERAFASNPKDYIERLYRMGLGQSLDIPIPGEPFPHIKKTGDRDWSQLSLYQTAIGYEVMITPLQMLTFYNAIANNGRMVKPRFVKELRRNGRVDSVFATEVIRESICTEKTLAQIRKVLEGVVESGTATNLKGAAYKIAGKTGTALIWTRDGGYKTRRYHASFVGYFPADAPKYSCVVSIYSPKDNGYYGNVTAGPVFRAIADKIYATRSEWFPWCEDAEGDHLPLYSKSGCRESIERSMREMRIKTHDYSGKSQWVDTRRRGDSVLLIARSMHAGLVPNVRDMSLTDALFLMENAGLRVVASGRGRVVEQSITPGKAVVNGSVVTLTMSQP